MLALRVEFLLDRAFAATHLDRDTVEWPPHPSRLFSALVAAAYETEAGPATIDALRWLECEPPPEITFPPASPRATGISYVPVNDASFTDSGIRNRQARQFPAACPAEPVIWFHWPRAEPTPPVREALAQLASEVPRLGHSASVVRAMVVEESPPHAPPFRTLVPRDDGEHLLRVARPGRLAALDASFTAGRRPTPGTTQTYGRPEVQPIEVARGPFEGLRVFRLVPRTEPRIWPTAARSLRLVERLRAAWMSVLGDGAPSVVHGHDGPHVALVPLPAVGHRHADGRVPGFGIAVPRRLELGDRTALDRALLRLDGLRFRVGPAEYVVQRVRPDEELPRTLDPHAWVRPDRFWASVSPVVMDQYPRRTLEAAAVVARSVVRLGLPEPRRVRVETFSAVPGAPAVMHFDVRREGQPKRPAFHVALEFDNEVAGPLILGQLRHFGIGLLRPAGAAARAFLDEEEA